MNLREESISETDALYSSSAAAEKSDVNVICKKTQQIQKVMEKKTEVEFEIQDISALQKFTYQLCQV